MARGITSTWKTGARRLTGALVVVFALAGAQAVRTPVARAEETPPLSKFCQPGATALAAETALPHVAAALAQNKALRILTIGAAPGRVGARGGYGDVIEGLITRTLKGIDVVMINRGVSGELAANAAFRMRNEIALNEPELVLWQVGTNDALAYVSVAEFADTLRDQIRWLKDHKIDVVLVGLQFASEMQRDEHYRQIRDALRKVAAEENVPVVRFYEAMQIVRSASADSPSAGEFERSEAGYNCLAQYVARAITLGAFAKNMPKRPAPAPTRP